MRRPMTSDTLYATNASPIAISTPGAITPSQSSAWWPWRATAPCSSGLLRGEKISRSGTPSKLSSPSYQFAGGGGKEDDDAAADPGLATAAPAVADTESIVAVVIMWTPAFRESSAGAFLRRALGLSGAAVQLRHHELAVPERLG